MLPDVFHEGLGALLRHHLLEPVVLQGVLCQEQLLQLEAVRKLPGDPLQLVVA